MSNYYIMKGGFYEVFGNRGMQAMSYQKVGDQMPIVKKFSSDDTMHDSSLTPKRVQGHRFGTYQGQPVIAQRYSNMSPSGQVMPHVVVQDMMEGRPNPLMIEDRDNRSKRRGKRGRGRGRTVRNRHKEPKVEVIAEADEMNMPQILKFIQMLKDRKELDHPKKKSQKHKRIELDIRDAELDEPVPEELEKNKKKKKRKKQKKTKAKKAKKAKKSKSQQIKALTKRLKRMKEE